MNSLYFVVFWPLVDVRSRGPWTDWLLSRFSVPERISEMQNSAVFINHRVHE